jgi:hypothetical protein
VHGDHAIFGLAQPPAPLFLNARRLVALFGIAGFINESNRVRPLMLSGDEFLQFVAERIFVPLVLGEEFLQSSWCDAGVQRNGLDAFFGEVGELPADIRAEVPAGVLAVVTVVEPIEEFDQHWFQIADLVGVHALPSGSLWESIV